MVVAVLVVDDEEGEKVDSAQAGDQWREGGGGDGNGAGCRSVGERKGWRLVKSNTGKTSKPRVWINAIWNE